VEVFPKMFPTDTDIETKITLETEAMPIDEESPFHILILGDWSGRESRSSTALSLGPIEIDRDNFDDVLRKLNVGLNLKFQGSGETALSLNFTELDDFHPDKIFQQLPLFADLRGVRQRLVKADTFDEAAREVRSWLVDDENSEGMQSKKEVISSELSQPVPDDLLDQILGKTDAESSTTKNKNVEQSELSAFIGKLVRPHIIQTDTAEQSRLLMIVDEVTSDLMRKILHHPQFQALESAWRGIYLLVRRIETDTFLKLFLFDISKDELAANLKSVNNLSDSDIYRTLFEKTVEPWAVVCGNYTFGLNVDDVSILIRLAKLGNAIDAPFISHIEPEMFGFKSFASASALDNWQIVENSVEGKLWETLRAIPDSKYLGMALPRFLARLPYGKQTDPTENFYFEEFTSSQEHEQYLWANPIFICALLFAQSFHQFGWNLISNFRQDVDGLPLYLCKVDNEAKTKPCAEITMSESNYEKLLNHGLISLISFRDTDKVRLGGLQSLAYPPSGLSGRWK